MPRATPVPPKPEFVTLGPDRVIVIGDLVGRGAFSTVYRGVVEGTSFSSREPGTGATRARVRAHRLRRPVAVKIFNALERDGREEIITGLARATRHAACVHHPNVASPQEFLLASPNEPAIVSEWVEGVSLDRFITAHNDSSLRVPTDLALFIALEIAEGLAGARYVSTPGSGRINLRHRGLSNREVLISTHGEVKVTDFGIALALRPSMLRLRSLARCVTTLAPEIAQGSPGDGRSDVFSLGMMMREMLIGPRFASGTSNAQMLEMARDGGMHSSPLERDLPDVVAAILRRATEIDPVARYPHAGILANDLRRACIPMGVGDGRFFLRKAIEDVVWEGELEDDDEPTEEGFDLHESGARIASADRVDDDD